MTADDRRDHLEAEIWRQFPRATVAQVDAILASADHYAQTLAADEVAAYAGRQQLAQLAAEIGPAVHYPGSYGLTACRNVWRSRPRHVTTDLDCVTCNACRRSRGFKDRLRERDTEAQRRAAA